MDNGDLTQMMVLGLAALAAGIIAYIILTSLIGGDQQVEKRVNSVTESRVGKQARRTAVEQANTRRKAVSDTLKDLEDKQKAKEKISLRLRLQRAGLDIPVKTFWIASAITGVMMGVALFIMMPTVPLIAVAAVVFIGTFGLPRWVVAKLTARRQAKFLDEFANAIDVIVRGVKSGLPLNECLGIIARESPSPVREEFQELVEQQRIGIPLGECFERMIGRVPLPEVKFFAIVIGIQQQAGGNLSEALGNLAGVLRDRKGIAAKVQALSSEAKASAFVLGSLPFAVMTLVYLSTPGYIMLLFTTKSGVFMLMVGAFWMFCGVMVMRKMINFKY
jgi:tight adherence protein B